MEEVLVTNLTNIGFAMALLAIAYLSNICFSLYYNIKISKESFDYSKLLNGVLKLIALCAGIATLAFVITLLPVYLTNIGIPIEEEFSSTFSVIAIIGLFVQSIYKYVRESYETLTQILSTNKTEETTKTE